MLENDTDYMQRCIALAKQGRYTVKSGALVGCVIVKAGHIIAEGWHHRPGQAHAEIIALKQAGENAKGATLYVSLEPCAHWGKTGPCCDEVIAAGVEKVVFGMKDPNPLVAGKGLDKIKAAAITLVGPILEDECAALNSGFIKRMTKGLPYVRCKLAMSLDGRTAMASGESKWITGSKARENVQLLRASSSVVVSGIGTVLADDPSLNVRQQSFEYSQPLRVVVDSQLKTPVQSKCLQLDGEVIIAHALDGNKEKVKQQGYSESTTLKSFSADDGKVDLLALMKYLAQEKECNDVFLEAGAELSGAMLKAGLIDELITFVAPKILGSEARPLFDLSEMPTMADQIKLEFIDMEKIGEDYKVRSRVLNTSAE